MGIFTRLKDIIGSNINSMLEKAEDPEKLIRLMIQEMEDTLVELKASCAGAIATHRRIQRDQISAKAKQELWAERAERALSVEREDLARDALRERRRYDERLENLSTEEQECASLVGQYHADIQKLEEKIATARERHRMLVSRHVHANRKADAENRIRQLDTSDAWVRFQQVESRVDRMEADAELINAHRKNELETAFADLERDDEIEEELEQLRAKMAAGAGENGQE